MLKSIKATFNCDCCGKDFTVRVDPAYVPPVNWSLYDIAEDSIRGGNGYEGPGDKGYWGSVEGDKQLCAECTKKGDLSVQLPL